MLMARSKTPRTPPRPAVPAAYDKYLAVEQAIRRTPIELIESLRARSIRRGDGSVGPMTFSEIAEIINELAAQHAAQHGITPVVISYEAVRRWWRHFHPEDPTRKPRSVDSPPITMAELERDNPATAAQVRKELGL